MPEAHPNFPRPGPLHSKDLAGVLLKMTAHDAINFFLEVDGNRPLFRQWGVWRGNSNTSFIWKHREGESANSWIHGKKGIAPVHPSKGPWLQAHGFKVIIADMALEIWHYTADIKLDWWMGQTIFEKLAKKKQNQEVHLSKSLMYREGQCTPINSSFGSASEWCKPT